MRELLRSTTAYRTVASDCAHGTLSHAMLVLFPDGKYLRELLRECARAFFGAGEYSRTGELIASESFSDCLFLPAEGGKLTADDGARIVDESLLRPVEGEKKLFVLDAFQDTTPLVQNKLLKILEEPPQGVYFLLGATADFSVLPTVLSRVKRLEVAPFSEEEIYRALGRNYRDEGRNKECAAASGGIYSVAEELLSGGGENFRLAEEFLLGDSPEKLCRALGDGKDGLKRTFFSALRLILRDALFYRTGQARFCAMSGGKIGKIAEKYPAGALISALELVTEAEKQIRFNANFGQCAEALAIRIGEEKQKWQKLS